MIRTGIATVVTLIVVSGILILVTKPSDTLPAAVTKHTSFPLYYPTPLPLGYTYQKGSARVENGIVFFTLQSNTTTISVTEQAAPTNPPNLTMLAGFTSLKTIAGDAVINSSGKQPAAIIMSNTTLISITGQRNMPSDIVAQTAQNMRSLP